MGEDFYKVWTEVPQRENLEAIDRHASSAVRAIEAGTAADQLGFTPPPEDRGDLETIRDTAHRLWVVLDQELIPLYQEDATADEVLPIRVRVEQLSSDLKTVRRGPGGRDAGRGRGADRPERELVRELAGAVHRRRGRGARARAAAGIRPVVVADRSDPEHRRPTRRDRVGRLLGPRRRREPRRAGRAGRQRQPDERRAPAPLHGARGGESAQVGVPGQHVPRAADTAERDHRILAGVARRDGRLGEREAGGVPRRHHLLGEPSALADQRRPRPLQGRGRTGRARGAPVLPAGGARARRGDGARARDGGRGPRRVRRRSGGRRRSTATSDGSSRSSSTCSRTR